MITQQSRVLTLISHYNYNQYLDKCILSILEQTRSSDGIVVVDDCSDIIPLSIIKKYPGVSLFKTRKNSGPYAIFDRMLGALDYDAILAQDADDWSAGNRLQTLIDLAVTEKADMVGSQIEVVREDVDIEAHDIRVPKDPRQVLLQNPNRHTFYLASALISRRFAHRLGGFSTGFRFGADSEFIRRAVFAGLVVNSDRCLYFRRVHQTSLTQNQQTGFGSDDRKKVQQRIQQAARRIVHDYRNDGKTDLHPIFKIETTPLEHIYGPSIRFVND